MVDWATNRLSITLTSPTIASVHVFSDQAEVLSTDAFPSE